MINKIVKSIVVLDERHTYPTKKSFKRAFKRQEKLMATLHARLSAIHTLAPEKDIDELVGSLLRRAEFNRRNKIGRKLQNSIPRTQRRIAARCAA